MKKIYLFTTIAFLAITIASCKKGFLSQEVNPNTPSVATPGQILSGAQLVTASNFNTGFTTFGIWLGYFAPSGNYTISATTEQYSFTNTSYSQFGLYNNITNYNNLIKLYANDPTAAKYAVIAKIMIAFNYQELVDEYNQVPYLQAQNSTQYLFPAYDDGQTVIYPDLFNQLDAAIALAKSSSSATSPGSADIIFGGDMTKWIKFANTLKLRLAVRQSNITAAKAGLVTELAKTSADGFLDDVTFASANPGFVNADANGGQQNPFYRTYGYTAAGAEAGGHAQNRANAFFVTFMKNLNDTLRLKQYYAPTLLKTEPASKVPPNNADHIVGNAFGNSNTYLSNANTSGLSTTGIDQPTIGAPIISGAEACFLLSEGIMSGLLTGDKTAVDPTSTVAVANGAQDYYQRGIVASFTVLGVPNAATAAATYYKQPIVDVNWNLSQSAPAPTGLAAGQPAWLRAVQTQKYIALFGTSIGEEYNEYRRTALPNLLGARSQAAGALGTGTVPNRIYFPSTEAQQNASNFALLPTVNPFGTPLIFWARNVNP